ESRQPIDLLEHAADHLAVRRSVERSLKRHLTHTPYCGQRRAKFVRRICRESTKLFKALLGPRQHGVEHPGQLPEFTARVSRRKSLGERFRGDLARLLGQRPKGRQHPSREEVTTRYGKRNGEGHANGQNQR